MPFSDPEERRRYQRELMKKKRAEEKERTNRHNSRTNAGANNIRPPVPAKAEKCPNGCGYKTKDNEKLQRHIARYCPKRINGETGPAEEHTGGLTRTNRTNTGPNIPSDTDIKPREYPRIWIKMDHSMEKGQIILKESLDGISWRTVTILKKEQPFERNGLIISGTWHKGSGKEVKE